MNRFYTYLFLLPVFLTMPGVLAAQDTTALPGNLRNQSITITSEYTPVLKPASKINFSSSESLPALPKTMLKYNVPAQSMPVTYEPAALYALAVNIDSTVSWHTENFVKLGYGNLSTPYAEAGLSLGDGVHHALSFYAKHTQSKGELPFQKFGKTYVSVNGLANMQDAHTLDAKVFFSRNSQYEYGFGNTQKLFTEAELLRSYATFGVHAGLANKKANAYNINYHPEIFFEVLNDNRSASEMNLKAEAPISKELIENVAFNLGITADMTSYKTVNANINNTIFYIAPAIAYATEKFSIVAGATPSWDRGHFYLLPQISLDARLAQRFSIFGGWKGYYNKTNYRTLTTFNPWIQQPAELLNNRVMEAYGGMKGSVGDHLNYNGKVGFQKLYNLPLFINDDADGRTFKVVNESQLNNLYIHGEVGYTQKESFSLIAGITKNFYNTLTDNKDPYGQIPLELSAALRWKLLKNIYLKSDAFLLNGIPYLDHSSHTTKKLSSAFDLNAGLEVNLIKNIGVWFQVNNLLNSKYQRWHQYPVLGANFLGGVVVNFNGKK